MPEFTLNPVGLLAKLFGQDAKRPVSPQWFPTGPVQQQVRGGIGGNQSITSNFTWDYYRSQLEISQERLDLYRDYEEMDEDDLIASVLDAVAEDATQTDFMTGRIIWVESANKDIEELGNQRLDAWNAEDNAPGICRETAKYGDCFEYLHLARNLGVVAHEYVSPHYVWKYEREGRLAGFTLSAQPEPTPENLLLPWQFVHFMRTTGRRYPGVQYGDAWTRPARRLYRKVQMVEDAMILYRIRRAPDRDVYYIDVGDAPPDQQVAIVRMWKRLFKKNISYDAQTGILRGELNPLSYDEDIFWPTKEGNNSRVDRLNGSSNVGDIFDVELLMNRMFAALRAPKDYFGFGESGVFDRGKSLEQQDVRWARGIKSIQRACTRGYARALQIDLALRGVDPTLSENRFVVRMCPVSAIDETQRAELYDIRLRAMEGLTRIVSDLEGLNKKAWFRFLLEKFGGFREGFLDKFIQETKKDAEDGVFGSGGFGLEGESLDSKEKKFLAEAYRELGQEIHDVVALGTDSFDLRYEPLPGADIT